MLRSTLFWSVLGFALGSLPFSYWLGRLALGRDIRVVGDGNPGSANVWRAGSWRLGVPALLLDFLKGALPVGLAVQRYGLAGWAMVPVALAPVLGHAFSPFLRLRGGKAVATTFGIWTGLTLWLGPTVLGLAVAVIRSLQSVDAWTLMLGMAAWLGVLVLSGGATLPLLAVWAGNLAILVWKHRTDLRTPPRLSPRLLRWLRRGS